jgi:hypothetical protein
MTASRVGKIDQVRGTITIDGHELQTLRGTVARLTVPPGKVVAHNHIRPRRTLGLSGFRAYATDPAEHVEPCGCGWAPEPGQHYRIIRGIP